MHSIHSYKVKGIDGQDIDFAAFQGKKILVVNVASACGYTPQYAALQDLATHFQDTLVVVGCPCNDFGGQEPADNDGIQQFCTLRFGVTFPLTAKLNILREPHPLYAFLTQKSLNGVADSTVKWNFQKYALNEQGVLEQVFPSATAPNDAAILEWLGA